MQRNELVQITRKDTIAEKDFKEFLDAAYVAVWESLYPPQILTDNLSNTVSNNIVTPADEPIPECNTCGACCAAFVCVDVEPDNPISSNDHWIVTKQLESGEFTSERFVKRRETDLSCTALDGIVGERVSCRIYENRPLVCRKFEAGSDRCHAVRRAYGIETFLSLDEMSAALGTLDRSQAK